MKVVVCGPPHSGKSVFVQQLRDRLIPLGIVAVFEGCPDGEGGWAGGTSQALVGELRHKGKFTTEFVGWVIESVRGSKMPITLVDVGGIRSPENERIFKECDAFIVLANPAKEGELEAWNAFGRAHGCQPIALLESVLHGTTALAPDQGDGVIRGVQAGLERGHRLGGPVLDALVQKLLSLVHVVATLGDTEATIHTARLADALGIPAAERDSRMSLRPFHARAILELSREALGEDEVRLGGACPSWVPALVTSAAKENVRLWDIRLGWMNIPTLSIFSEGSEHLNWKVSRDDNGHTVVAFNIPGGVFDPAQLEAVQPPSVDGGSFVILAGRGPHWLVAAIARAYTRAGHSVAVAALHESETHLTDGHTWAEANPGMVPAVMISGPEIGSMVAVPIAAIK